MQKIHDIHSDIANVIEKPKSFTLAWKEQHHWSYHRSHSCQQNRAKTKKMLATQTKLSPWKDLNIYWFTVELTSSEFWTAFFNHNS